MVDASRRILLTGSLAAGSVGVAVATGLLSPRLVLADWQAAAFNARDLAAAIQGLWGIEDIEKSDAVIIKVPDIAENGAVVPVTVETTLTGVGAIAILAAGNQNPLLASFDFGSAAVPFVSTRIKMTRTAEVIALVRQGDRLLSNSKEVRVAIGSG